MPDVTLHLGDCLAVLRGMPAASVDAVVTDPPAGIGFMGKTWDRFEAEGGSHISDRLPTVTVGGTPNRNPICRACGKRQRGEKKNGIPACACEHPEFDTDAWRLRGRTAFVAFLSAALSEARRVIRPGGYALVWAIPRTSHWTATALEDAGWEIRDRISHLFGQGFPKGRGCLKPACEDWWLCRAPGRGVRELGIDECRIATTDDLSGGTYGGVFSASRNPDGTLCKAIGSGDKGRWPANLCLSHHPECNGTCHADCPVRLLDEQSGERRSGGKPGAVYDRGGDGGCYGGKKTWGTSPAFSDAGGVSRFFYCSKASRRDRGEGNTHPTVKSTALMEWLIRLVAREGETVLDPFAGSGSTLVAALRCGRNAIGIEQNPEYHAIAKRRIAEAQAVTPLFAEDE